MRITLSQLKRLPVETKSGTKLGKVYDLVLEIEGQTIAQYHVKSALVVGEKYLVSRNQVIEINSKKMIVEDNVKKQLIEDEPQKKLAVEPERIIMRE